MPDLQSATKFIKQLNPQNKSGTIPQALDLLNNLKKHKPNENRKMPDAVGPKELMQMLQFVFNKFSKKKLDNITQILAKKRSLSDAELIEFVNAIRDLMKIKGLIDEGMAAGITFFDENGKQITGVEHLTNNVFAKFVADNINLLDLDLQDKLARLNADLIAGTIEIQPSDITITTITS